MVWSMEPAETPGRSRSTTKAVIDAGWTGAVARVASNGAVVIPRGSRRSDALAVVTNSSAVSPFADLRDPQALRPHRLAVMQGKEEPSDGVELTRQPRKQ